MAEKTAGEIIALPHVVGYNPDNKMSKPSTIAIDGPVAVGKTTISRMLAERLGYRYLDTGVMYRALTWKALKLKVDLDDAEQLATLARKTRFELRPPGNVLVDGEDVSAANRGQDVERAVSLVAKVAGVREALVQQQRALGLGGRVVMAGRDIGTVVLPDADLKIYLCASVEERARRRYDELVGRGETMDYQMVLAELKRRDGIDSERAISPLRRAPDARLVNTDNLSPEAVVSEILRHMD